MNESYYIITRNTEDTRASVKMRQCWTGEYWSKELNDVLVFATYSLALSDKFYIDSVHSIGDLVPPAFKLHPADIRKIKESDILPGWQVMTPAQIIRWDPSLMVGSPEQKFRLDYGFGKNEILETGMTPREMLVLLLRHAGLSVPAIVETGLVRSLGVVPRPISGSRVHQILAKATRKVWRRVLDSCKNER